MINNIRLRIADNGRGLPGETGTYDQDELAARVIGPRSIANRVAESGGTLSLSTSSKGIELSIQLPCTSQPAQQIHATQAYSLT
jgi:signal transduction histidine kinase